MTKASICTIGDEILIGQIVDTNSARIASALDSLGIKVERMLSIADDTDEIISGLTAQLSDCDIVICTGGLGPTKDDITKPALLSLSRSGGWVEFEAQTEVNRGILHSRGLDMLESNRLQSMVPDKCDPILNRRGTAPIMAFHFDGSRFGHKAALYSMPGVPFETEAALPDVLEDIHEHFSLSKIHHHTLMTYGLAESALAEKLAPWEDALPRGIHLAYLPNPLTGVRLRLSSFTGEHERLEAEAEKLKALLGELVYSDCDDTLESAIGKLLRGSGYTLSAAESCTGGEISHLITTIPGASEYYLGSVTSYSADVKCKVLGVKRETIDTEGIVSSAVAAAMAEGVRRLTGSTYSVATTGWADAYGDEHEPAGTVWIGVSGPEGTVTERRRYRNDRKRNIQRFAASALDLLRRYIEGSARLSTSLSTRR